jgi:hypothetical protein
MREIREAIKISLTREELNALAGLAEREMRPIPLQAQHMVVEALRRRRLLSPPKESDTRRGEPVHAAR